ncbi:MAG: DUF3857 domain-containing protein [Bacteroidia bacterium]|nr:DUF3857 domain-containing protein [Bacteroidia bacterium]
MHIRLSWLNIRMLLLGGLWVAALPLLAQYPVSEIPDSLKTQAKAVIRKTHTRLDVSGPARAVVRSEFVITILEKAGEKEGVYYLPFDEKLDKVLEATGVVYNAAGTPIRKLKRNDYVDLSANDASSLITSQRVLIAAPAQTVYPYTVSFSVTKETSGLMYFPRWAPQLGYNLPVQVASLDIVTPASLQVRFRALDMEQAEYRTSTEASLIRHHWEMHNLKPVEEISLTTESRYPRLLIAPDAFTAEGITSNMSTWESFGDFFYQLNEGRDKLPAALQTTLDSLLADAHAPRDKVAAVYQYMQKHCRYVSIQLGIGGWQTLDAEYVYTHGFGDCKALSNYMKSMLGYAGIPSHIALVGAGPERSPVIADFISNQFNHVILCVPLAANDTVWLECTSSLLPAGYLGGFTEDRHVLLVTPQGGKLVRTPSSMPEDNLRALKADITLTPQGNAHIRTVVTATGNRQDLYSYLLHMVTGMDRDKKVRQMIPLSSFDAVSYHFDEKPNQAIPCVDFSWELDARGLSSVSGPRLFLICNPLRSPMELPATDPGRTRAVDLTEAQIDRDTLIYHLPPGFGLESANLVPTEIKTEFAYYRASVDMLEPTVLRYVREMRMERIRLPASYYELYRDFVKQVNKADKMQVVLTQKS